MSNLKDIEDALLQSLSYEAAAWDLTEHLPENSTKIELLCRNRNMGIVLTVDRSAKGVAYRSMRFSAGFNTRFVALAETIFTDRQTEKARISATQDANYLRHALGLNPA